MCEEAVVEAPAQLRHLRLDVLCPETRVLEMNKNLKIVHAGNISTSALTYSGENNK